jgi:hypothetical protein
MVNWARYWEQKRSGGAGESYDTVGYSPQDEIKRQIIEMRNLCINEIVLIERRKARGMQTNTHRLKSLLIGLYLHLVSSLRRSMSKHTLMRLDKNVHSDRYADLDEAFMQLSDYLDDKRIILFDSSQSYDYTNMEEENRVKGL